jgi:hypothetical protein
MQSADGDMAEVADFQAVILAVASRTHRLVDFRARFSAAHGTDCPTGLCGW